MRPTGNKSSPQKGDEAERGIAGLVVASLAYDQFLERLFASLLQFRSLRRINGTDFERKLQPQLKPTL
jgi:hypothetical protein